VEYGAARKKSLFSIFRLAEHFSGSMTGAIVAKKRGLAQGVAT